VFARSAAPRRGAARPKAIDLGGKAPETTCSLGFSGAFNFKLIASVAPLRLLVIVLVLVLDL